MALALSIFTGSKKATNQAINGVVNLQKVESLLSTFL